MRRCIFASIADIFNFGKYAGLSLADVLDFNPSYLNWCVKNITGGKFQVEDSAIEEIRMVYPSFKMDDVFESMRIESLHWNNINYDGDDEEDEYDYEVYDPDSECSSTYGRYYGSWAQEVEGYSDEDIDTIFDRDPSAYWNID